MPHAVVHFEIGGQNDGELAAFYSALFGWTTQPVPGAGYTLIDTRGGTGINGGVERRTGPGGSLTFYIQTDDLQAALDKINLLGGRTIRPITELPGMATYALFEDLDGLVIGLVLATGGPAISPAAGRGRAGGLVRDPRRRRGPQPALLHRDLRLAGQRPRRYAMIAPAARTASRAASAWRARPVGDRLRQRRRRGIRARQGRAARRQPGARAEPRR